MRENRFTLMAVKCTVFGILFLMFNSVQVSGQIETLGKVELTGFFDLQYQRESLSSVNPGVNYGQFELDLAKSMSKYVAIEGAIAYNPESAGFELGAGFVDFHLFGSDEEHPLRGKFLTHSGILVGQFDVPFGIDYLYIPSPDRKLVSAPLLNVKTIDSWNDFGVNVYGASERANFMTFVVNGFNSGVALGGRIGFLPSQMMEVGASYLTDLENLRNVNSTAFGLDFLLQADRREVRAEYQVAEGLIDGGQDELTTGNSHRGYYLQFTENLDETLSFPVFAVLRYGYWSSDSDRDETGENDYLNRFTLGLGYAVTEGVEVRTEYLSNGFEGGDRENCYTIQTVVSF